MFPFYNKDRGLIPSLIQPGKSLVPGIAPPQAPKTAPVAVGPAPTNVPVSAPTTTVQTPPPTNNTDGGSVTMAPPAPTAAEIKAAQDAALVKQRQAEISPLLDRYNSMFDGLYGRINSTAADQAATTQKNYADQRDTLTNDYNIQVPQIDMSYYLSGIGDSSLRLKGQGQAENAYRQSINQVDKNQQNDLAQIGQSLASETAKYKADQAGIGDIRRQVAQSTNPDELMTLENNILAKTHGLEADAANFDTAGGYRGQLAKVAPVQDLAPIQKSLDTLMQGAAHPALKTQIATQIINGAGLSDAQKSDLFKKYLGA